MLNLVRFLSTKWPAVFSQDGDFKTVGLLLLKMFQLMAEPKFKTVHQDLAETVVALASLLSGKREFYIVVCI